ncbi:hypothetical protein [uncultured Winogradskyella sp.]|uniref:hypothetical protein n=1 Tax=uncultured Winogradskyella sp. TaxID=395353 RepID=UPI00263614D9|nr:hypothetical protein [uncultured Winogradskyella sp.]
MDEFLLYQHHHAEVIERAKKIIVALFKKQKSKRKVFSSFYPDFQKRIKGLNIKYYDEYRNKYSNALNVFDSNLNKYEGNELEKIQLVFKYNIFPLFKNYSEKELRDFIKSLGRRDALRYLYMHLDYYYNYYKLVYETISFQYIYLRDFDNLHFEDSDQYREMIRIKNPDKKNIDIPLSDILNENTDTSRGNKLSKEFENEFVEKLKSFDDEERFILMRLIYNNFIVQKKRSINFIDFIRICKIIGGYEDLRIFIDEKPLGNNSAYQKISKSLKNIPSNSRVETFKSLLNKIDFIKSSQINSILKVEKNKKS